MTNDPPSDAEVDLGRRLEELGRALGEREAAHAEGLATARACAEKLRAEIEAPLERFHRAAAGAGAPHLHVALSEIRIDDKHLRAVEFNLCRGRHKAVVTVKSRGEVTLVGPFRIGKDEGPCLSFPVTAAEELRQALASFLERFLEEAAAP
jgi:hypothetical protein